MHPQWKKRLVTFYRSIWRFNSYFFVFLPSIHIRVKYQNKFMIIANYLSNVTFIIIAIHLTCL